MRNVGLTLILLLAVLSGCTRKPAQEESTADAGNSESGVKVRVQAAEMRVIEDVVTALGKCEPPPDRMASITPAIEGQVERLLVKLGDEVKQGQGVVQLDSRVAQANLAEKKATRDGLVASLNLLKAPPRPEDVNSQESALEQAKLSYEKAHAVVERLRPLATKQEISAGQLYEAEVAASIAKLQLESIESQLKLLKLGARAEAVAEAEGKIAIAEASCGAGRAQLDQYTLKSPIDGIVDDLSCHLGQTLSPGAAIGTIVDSKKLLVSIWLPVHEAIRVKTGQHVSVSPASHHRANSESDSETQKVTEGEVIFVGHVEDAQTGNLAVQVSIDNADGQFVVGELVAARITVAETEIVLAVPVAAVVDFGEGPTFNLVRDGKSSRVQPKLGRRDTTWVEYLGSELKEPLHDGDMIVVDGGYNLPDGNEVSTEKKTEDAEHAKTEADKDAPAATGEPQ
jgi:RND family efflux transporter MFP subunit